MNNRQLSDRIGNVDEALVAGASGEAPKRSRAWPRLAAAAAALALIAGGAALGLRGGAGGPAVTPRDTLEPTGGPAIPDGTLPTGPEDTQPPALPLASGDLMAGYEARTAADAALLTEENAALAADFGLRLLRACDTGGNVLISPYSVLSALGMTALGARGETLSEMTAVLGMDPEALGAYLRALGESLPGEALGIANAVWFNEDSRFHVEPDFLRRNADTYYAGVQAAPFDDGTLRDINAWVSDRTRGMIPELLDAIPRDAVMYLLNALAFEARWEKPYETVEHVRPDVFTTEAGEERQVTMMYEDLDTLLVDEGALGFLKLYEGGRYAFAALLPGEGVTVDEYLRTLTGERLRACLDGAQSGRDGAGRTGIPKFTLEGSCDLAGALSAMGMPTAFDREKADLTGLGYSDAGNLYVSRVLHKTFLEVAEDGTRAAAVTAVEISDKAFSLYDLDIVLDRPFICMIVDTDTYTPLFLALVRDIGE